MRTLLTLLWLVILTGCFTASETYTPLETAREIVSVETNVTLAVRGFATSFAHYERIDGYQTVVYGGNGWYGTPPVATAHTLSVLSREQASDAFLNQARNRLEDFGFNTLSQTPDYIVEARFAGPVPIDSDNYKTAAWIFLSLLTCDYGTQTWTAHLTIRDNRTGRRVFSREYDQKYEVLGFSPLPLVGIACYDRTDRNLMQCCCLGMLTNRMIDDVVDFLRK